MLEPITCQQDDVLEVTLYYNTNIQSQEGTGTGPIDVIWETKLTRDRDVIHESISRYPLEEDEYEGEREEEVTEIEDIEDEEEENSNSNSNSNPNANSSSGRKSSRS